MKNHNVSYFNGDLESTIKNGNFNNVLVFSGLPASFTKIFDSFANNKVLEPTADFPYKQTLYKFRSHFRIGEQQLRLIHLDDIITRNTFDKAGLEKFIHTFCIKRKGTINAFPILGAFTQHIKEIENILNDNVRDTKFVIIS